MSLVLGAIADDFTGATDLANNLVRAGMRTLQVIGIPGPDLVLENIDAVVVAFKSRSCPVREGVDNSLACLLYTSDAADDLLCVDLGGRRIIKKKKKKK